MFKSYVHRANANVAAVETNDSANVCFIYLLCFVLFCCPLIAENDNALRAVSRQFQHKLNEL